MAKRDLTRSMDELFPQEEPDYCRVCNREVVDARWSYCSERCRDIANAVQRMFIWDAVREKVLERDDYTCQHCGVSKDRWWRAYHQSRNLAKEYNEYDRQEQWEKWFQKKEALQERFMIDSPNGGFHVDHVERIADGGHPFDEDNLQTLCKYCHREKTAEENSGPRDPGRPEEELTLEDYIDA